MKLGLVGYGTGGRYFHSPYIAAAEGVELVGIVARSPQRIAEVQSDFPEVAIYASLTELIAAGVDAVTITTPRRLAASSCSRRSRRACTSLPISRSHPMPLARSSWLSRPRRRACC